MDRGGQSCIVGDFTASMQMMLREKKAELTVSSDNLKFRVFLFDVVDHVDLVNRVSLGGVL